MTILDADAVRRRKISFRAWHRGTREMDLIMGRFADAELARLDAAGLDSFEALMEQPDPDLYKWVSGEAPVPPDVDAAFLARIRDFHANSGALRG
jgi:antitoxin CptB